MKCSITFKGLAKKKGSKVATSTKHITLKAGKTKLVSVKVKPRYVKTYKKAKSVVVKTNVKVGKVKTVVYKKVRVLK